MESGLELLEVVYVFAISEGVMGERFAHGKFREGFCCREGSAIAFARTCAEESERSSGRILRNSSLSRD